MPTSSATRAVSAPEASAHQSDSVRKPAQRTEDSGLCARFRVQEGDLGFSCRVRFCSIAALQFGTHTAPSRLRSVNMPPI